MQTRLVQSLGWEDPLKEGMVTHSSILDWRISMDRRAWQATVHGTTESQTWLRTAHSIPNLSLQFPVLTVPDLGENLKLRAVTLKKYIYDFWDATKMDLYFIYHWYFIWAQNVWIFYCCKIKLRKTSIKLIATLTFTHTYTHTHTFTPTYFIQTTFQVWL